MKAPKGYLALKGSEHALVTGDKKLKPSAEGEPMTVTLILRRRPAGAALKGLKEFSVQPGLNGPAGTRAEFAAKHGADAGEMKQVVDFAEANGLAVLETHQARRSVVVRGPVSAISKAFGVAVNDYSSPLGRYRSPGGPAHLPAAMAKVVEAVIGLHERPVPAKHWVTRRQGPTDPAGAAPLTPQQVAQLYNFPPGDGAGQTIGIYEMATSEGAPGYAKEDLARTMEAFGGGLRTPAPIDVSVDGVANSGVSDGETGLDITVAGAIAPAAKLAVYFTGGTTQNILHALERMIHPGEGDPQPDIISISYGWGPDDESAGSFSNQEYAQLGQLFQDAANLNLTVLVSSGDSGAFVASPKQAQTSYPSTEPWVISCGGTSLGNIHGMSFEEFAWNDGAKGGATGGGVSARFPVPAYQAKAGVPKRNGTKKPGRGVPDLAGNASPFSGYPQFINGRAEPVGGTSAVAPLYAGLLARINANLGRPVGFINPRLYSAAAGTFRGITSPPGPANNSFNGVTGYPVTAGWNACTGRGSAVGAALQTALQPSQSAAKEASARPSAPQAAAPRQHGRM
jgi:kumamolisin